MSRVEVSMATLEVGAIPEERPLTGTITQNEIRWRYLPEKIQSYKPPSNEGGEGARIRNDWERRQRLIHYDHGA